MSKRWSKAYFADLAERVGSVAIYGAVTLVTTSLSTPLDVSQLWPVLGVPVVLSLLKGLAANLSDPESGASLLPAPPGPVIEPTNGMEG